MDPFSVSVNVLAVLCAVAQSTKFLYKFFDGVSNAQTDIKHYCSILQVLTDTFSALQALYVEDAAYLTLPANFVTRSVDFITELKAVNVRLGKTCARLATGRFGRIVESVKWALVSGTWLKKFFTRLREYHVPFSLGLICVQLRSQTSLLKLLSSKHGRLVLKPVTEGYDSASIEQAAKEMSYSDVASSPPPDTTVSSKKAEAFSAPTLSCRNGLRKIIGPLRLQKSYQLPGSYSSITLRFRSVYRQTWAPWDTTATQTQYESLGQCFVLHATLPFLWSRQLNLDFSVSQEAAGISSNRSLSFSRVVPRTAPIMQSVRQGDVLSVHSLFQSGKASIYDELEDGTTLLHIAAFHEDLCMVKFLISRNARLDATDKDLDTPLHLAAAKGRNLEIVRILIDNGCDTWALNNAGRTALHQYFNPVTRQMLLMQDKLFDLYAQDNEGMTIIHYLSYSKTTQPKEIQHLIGEDIACLAVRDNQGRYPLDLAASRGNAALVSCILDLGRHSTLSLTDPKGRSLLHSAVSSKRTETIELVAQHYPKIFVKDDQGRSILHYAIAQRNAAAVQKIIHLGGAHLQHQADYQGETPLDLADRLEAASASRGSCGASPGKVAPYPLGSAIAGNHGGVSKEHWMFGLRQPEEIVKTLSKMKLGIGRSIAAVLMVLLFVFYLPRRPRMVVNT